MTEIGESGRVQKPTRTRRVESTSWKLESRLSSGKAAFHKVGAEEARGIHARLICIVTFVKAGRKVKSFYPFPTDAQKYVFNCKNE